MPVVEIEEWRAIKASMPFATFDHTDFDEAVTALAAGNFDQTFREGHQYRVVA